MAGQDIIAVVFDFDDTLAPDTTTALLRDAGIDTERFWRQDVRALVEQGFDPAVAWLNLLLDNVGEGKPLGALNNGVLSGRGAALDQEFYEGLPELFEDLRAEAKNARDVHVEFYIISGGLKELLEGSSIVRDNFEAVYGNQLGENEETGTFDRIKRVVTFTEKTRYLFEINKGIGPDESQKNPFLVNRDVPPAERRVSLGDLIYIGDGLTDIPCFSLVQKSGGVAFGVFDPRREESAKRAFLEFLQPSRVIGMYAPRYGPDHELGALLRVAVATKVGEAKVRRGQASR